MTKFKTGNRAAAKPAELLQTSQIVLRVTPAEKAALIQAAYPKTLSSYMREKLNMGKP
jgi:hypothetical protein